MGAARGKHFRRAIQRLAAERENKKEAAYLGELTKIYDEMMGGQNSAAATVPAQDTGQGLLNMNGWTDAFHKTENPLAQFDLGTAEIAPTLAGNAAPAVPSNAWANALPQSGANTTGLVPPIATAPIQQAQAQGATRAPIVTPMDFYRAALELAGTKRFRMLSPDRVQAMLTPYMKINEEARQEQMRNNIADAYMNATDGAGRIKTVTGGALRGIVPESMANTIFNQNKPTVSTVDTGGQILFNNIDPMTGMPINTWAVDRTLTPQQQLDHQFRMLQHEATVAQQNAQMDYNYANLRQQGDLERRRINMESNAVTGQIYTGNDGHQYVLRKNAPPMKLSEVPGLNAQQRTVLEDNGKTLTNIQTRRKQLQKEKNAWILKNQIDEAKKVEERIKALDTLEQRILQQNNSIINSGNTGQQGQTGQLTNQTVEQSTPPVGQQPAPNNNGNNVQQTPPVEQSTPDANNGNNEEWRGLHHALRNRNKHNNTEQPNQNNRNTVQPMPPAVPPTAQDIPKNAVLVNDEGQFYTQEDIDKIIVDRNIDGAMFVDSLRGAGYVTPSEFAQSGKKFRLTDNTPHWVMSDGTKITYGQEKALIAKVERGDLPDIKNTEEFYRDLQNKGAIRIGKNLGTTNTVANAQAPFVNVLGNNDTNIANASANNSSFGDFFNIFGATPAYADENISSNNTTLASDTNTEAGIQRALSELNGQFGEQRWADWATAFNPQDFTNNNYSGLRNNFSLPANEVPISNYSPNRLDSNMVLASNKRARPQRTYSGYYSGDTRNGGQYSSIINRQAKTHNVDPDLIAAIIQQESGGNSSAVSQAGAGGLIQLMPKTARGLGVTDVFDPEQNIAGGTKYIAQMLRRYNGNIEKALWAYNAGPGNADKGNLPEETKKYIPSVMARYRRLKGIAATTPNTPKRATRRRRRTRSRRIR